MSSRGVIKLTRTVSCQNFTEKVIQFEFEGKLKKLTKALIQILYLWLSTRWIRYKVFENKMVFADFVCCPPFSVSFTAQDISRLYTGFSGTNIYSSQGSLLMLGWLLSDSPFCMKSLSLVQFSVFRSWLLADRKTSLLHFFKSAFRDKLCEC